MRTHSYSIRAAGFTLVEVMIALLIGMIGLIVMMQTFAVSEGFKRTATSGTDSQINGGVALYMLQRELRLSGAGLNNLMTMGCPSVIVWNNTTGSSTNLNMFPFEINTAGVPPGDANTDTITIAYGTAPSFVAGIALLSNQTPTPTAPFALSSNYDTFETGDLFVSVQPGAGAGGGPSCVLHEATRTASAAGNCGAALTAATVEHNTGAYLQHTPTGCVSTTPRFNSATGIKDTSGVVVPLVTASTPPGSIYDLGKASVKVYAIRGGNLTMCDWIATNCALAANYNTIVNDIVSLRAVYGMNLTPSVSAVPGDFITTTWQRSSLTTNAFLPSRVTAVTLEITARSSLKEKRSDGTACVGVGVGVTAGDPKDVTPAASRPDRQQDWIYQTSVPGAGIDLSSVSADWNCYRYKLFQTSVPLRNLIWRPS
jgi:type IV pilus assembly protein PilW